MVHFTKYWIAKRCACVSNIIAIFFITAYVNRYKVWMAILEWKQATCINLMEVSTGYSGPHLKIQRHADDCRSFIGMVSTTGQDFYISEDCENQVRYHYGWQKCLCWKFLHMLGPPWLTDGHKFTVSHTNSMANCYTCLGTLSDSGQRRLAQTVIIMSRLITTTFWQLWWTTSPLILITTTAYRSTTVPSCFTTSGYKLFTFLYAVDMFDAILISSMFL